MGSDVESDTLPTIAKEGGISTYQRIPGVADADASPTVRDVFEFNEKALGRVANLVRILAHTPEVLKWWSPFMAAMRQPNAGAVSDVRLRNLAILKTSLTNACRY